MNTTNRLPTTQGDNVDRLLSTFYRSEMPATWPDAPDPWTTQSTATTERTGHQSSRSRWALAASVALLIGGCWYVSGQMTDGKKRSDVNFDGSADSKHVKDAGKDKPKTP